MSLEQCGPVFVLRLGAGENRLNPDSLASLAQGLAVAEAESGPSALVTTGSPEFYSNGYDLDWLRAQPVDAQRGFVRSHEQLLARLLRSPVPSVAAVSGHAIGGGALVALAHDYRVMRADRASFWLPEIDARIPFRPGMTALLQARLAPDVCRDLVLSGERLSGQGARAARVVDEIAEPEVLLERAIARADALAQKDRRTWGRMKERLYGAVADALDPPSFEVDQSRGSP
jgi:enoyl-CoA hydratase/carnithine racemase